MFESVSVRVGSCVRVCFMCTPLLKELQHGGKQQFFCYSTPAHLRNPAIVDALRSQGRRVLIRGEGHDEEEEENDDDDPFNDDEDDDIDDGFREAVSSSSGKGGVSSANSSNRASRRAAEKSLSLINIDAGVSGAGGQTVAAQAGAGASSSRGATGGSGGGGEDAVWLAGLEASGFTAQTKSSGEVFFERTSSSSSSASLGVKRSGKGARPDGSSSGSSKNGSSSKVNWVSAEGVTVTSSPRTKAAGKAGAQDAVSGHFGMQKIMQTLATPEQVSIAPAFHLNPASISCCYMDVDSQPSAQSDYFLLLGSVAFVQVLLGA